MKHELDKLELDTETNPTLTQAGGDMEWFNDARFGLFIHWGIYAAAARHEQVQRREEISTEQYERYARHFNPDLFDPDQWADLAVRSGFRYVVITSKHIDGFCMWDSALTDFKITNTPYGKDILGPFIQAFRKRGIRIGLYYTQIDHHHPHFTIDDLHYLCNRPDRDELNSRRDMNVYRRYLHGHIKELVTQFGQIDVLWFDGGNYMRSRKIAGEPWAGKNGADWDETNLLKLIRTNQPKVLINDRLGDGQLPGSVDFLCHEQALPNKQLESDQGRALPWESPQTFSGSWGYYRDEFTWKSAKQVLEMLIYSVSRGGNLLLNVGPTGRGEIENRAVERLEVIGEWMRRHSRSIYGCTAAPIDIPAPPKSLLTYHPKLNRLYVHVLDWPATPGVRGASMHLYWNGFDSSRIEYAQLLDDASEVRVYRAGDSIKAKAGGWPPNTPILDLPVLTPATTIPVVEVFLR